MITVQYIKHLPYDEMEKLYNTSYHKDVKPVHSTYDAMNTWEPYLSHLMRRRPWARIPIEKNQLTEIIELSHLSQFRSIKKEEINERSLSQLCELINEGVKKNNKEHVKWFARLNECSMKKNQRGSVLAYNDAFSILQSIIEDRRVYQFISNDKVSSTCIYLSDFDDTLDIENEYRVFVYNGKVTGISQYRWFHKLRESLIEEEAKELGCRITTFVEQKLLPCLPNAATASLVADVYCENKEVSLIEVNLFGGHTGCGSALFNWKHDESVIYGDGKNVVFRLIAPE